MKIFKYIRSLFCNHEWEMLSTHCESYADDPKHIYIVQTFHCAKCGAVCTDMSGNISKFKVR